MKRIIIGIILLALLAFGFWTIGPLFFKQERDDDLSPEIMALLAEDTTPQISEKNIETEIPPTLEEVSIENSDPTEEEPSQESTQSVSAQFPITGTFGHSASGNIRIIKDGDQTIVRYEDYDGTNGPDIRVYLATDKEATKFIDLGKVRGNKGNINYVVPEDVNIDEYTHVLTWCRAFSVLFDSAEIK